jgi:hypothetical protein
MTAPYWLVILVAVIAFLAGVVASMRVSIRSRARGESLPKMWAKQGCVSILAMVAVFAAYFGIFGLVRLFYG